MAKINTVRDLEKKVISCVKSYPNARLELSRNSGVNQTAIQRIYHYSKPNLGKTELFILADFFNLDYEIKSPYGLGEDNE